MALQMRLRHSPRSEGDEIEFIRELACDLSGLCEAPAIDMARELLPQSSDALHRGGKFGCEDHDSASAFSVLTSAILQGLMPSRVQTRRGGASDPRGYIGGVSEGASEGV